MMFAGKQSPTILLVARIRSPCCTNCFDQLALLMPQVQIAVAQHFECCKNTFAENAEHHSVNVHFPFHSLETVWRLCVCYFLRSGKRRSLHWSFGVKTSPIHTGFQAPRKKTVNCVGLASPSDHVLLEGGEPKCQVVKER